MDTWAKIGIAAVGIGGAMWWQKMKLFNSVRGLRNNNPGNIERNGTQWEGMAADQSGDDRFIVFVSPEYGIRAMARILASYKRQGVDTIGQIVSRWAPPVENNTQAYIESVSYKTGLSESETVSEEDYPQLIAAIVKHENGIQPYSMELIRRGVSMA